MVIKQSSAAEVTRPINRLLSADVVAREAAAARLTILGPRAVDRLHVALARARTEEQLVAVLDVLERIGDPRSLDVAEPLLADARDGIATAAVALARRVLHATEAQTAARATDVLLGLALDAGRSLALRQAAALALQDLPADVLAPFRDRMPSPPPPAPEAPADAPPPETTPEALVDGWLDGTRTASPAQLSELVARAGAVLPIPQLHRLIERARAQEAAAPGTAEWRQLRGCVHQVLADRDSRVALYDLRETLERPSGELTVGMLSALSRVGDAACLEPIADAWARTDDAWLKTHLHDALAAVVAREHLTARHAGAKRVVSRHPQLAGLFSTPSRKKPSAPRSDRR